jgi:hypothetical protein
MTKSIHHKTAAGIFLIAGALGQPGAALAQEKLVEYTKQTAGAYSDVQALNSLMVLDFSGEDSRPTDGKSAEGKAFAGALAGELKNLQINNKLAFPQVRNEAAGAQLSKVRSAEAGAALVSQLGSKFGVDGVVWGEVNKAEVTSNVHQGERVKTTLETTKETFSTLTTIFGSKSSEKTEKPVMVDCTKYVGDYVVTPAIFKTNGGKILYTKQIVKNSSVEICGGVVKNSGGFLGLSSGSSSQPLSPAGIIANLRQQAVAEMIAQLKPQPGGKAKVAFKTKFPDITDAALRTKLGGAIDWLNGNDPETACNIFIGADSGTNTKQYSLLFNIAACFELRNNDRAAKDAYLAARQILLDTGGKADPSLIAAIKRLTAS